MELGEKLLQARQAAGLSQRQLCDGVITRNMLSQIEHGTARPSMDTLGHLAERLGKPVSYFLEEDVVTSPNQALMAQAEACRASGQPEEARQLLRTFRQPDPVFFWQWQYLTAVTTLEAARQAMASGKQPYARQMLENLNANTAGFPELERQRLLLLGQLEGEELSALIGQLPSLDEELLLRAAAALRKQDAQRAVCLLMAAEDQSSARWQLLRGQAFLLEKEYARACACLEAAQAAFPEICWPLLEGCFRELGDFQQAYHYACLQK